MRCGLVRLMTRRSPYDLRIRRKGLNSTQRGESGALINIAESRVIGRYCAHKICRLMEKSSKIFCRVLSGNNISSRKISSSKIPFFDNWNDVHLKYPIQRKPLSRNGLENADPLTNHDSFAFAKRTNSKIGLSQLNYTALDREIPNSSKHNPARPYHVLSKHKVPRYKRYPSQRISTRRTVNSNFLSNKRLRASNIKNKFVSSRKLYTLQSPFVTYPDCEDNVYLNRIKHSLRSQHTDLKSSNNDGACLDHNVLNHLNETSNISLCGCDICDKKLKEYDHKNKKINQLLQNKIMKILNYCKKKNPFYRIYTQKDRSTVNEECLRKFSMYGVNGWLEYLDAYKCSDESPCALKSENKSCNPATKNKCVNTKSELPKPDGFSYNVCLKPIDDNISKIGNNVDQSKKINTTNETAAIKYQISNCQCGENQETLKVNKEDTAFKYRDESTTQTQDICDPQVTNYYYITNNTMNTSCCCREENLNETKNKSCTPEEPNKMNKKQPDSCEAVNATLTNTNKNRLKKKTVSTNTIKQTLNKVYNVMMTPIYNKDNFSQEKLQKSDMDNTTAYKEEKNEFYNNLKQNSIRNVNMEQGDSPMNLKKIENFEVLDFDAYMDLKYNELKEKSFGDSFRYLDDLRFSEVTNKPFVQGTNLFTHDNEQQNKSLNFEKKNEDYTPLTNNIPDCKLQEIEIHNKNEERKNESLTTNHEWKGDSYVPPCQELGPLDCTKNFIIKNSERYKEKASILTRGPNFSQFPNSNWRDSLFQYDDKLSKTFDVSKKDEGNETIKINTDKKRDLAKYSEINIAIEKVKKRISSIINESDENINDLLPQMNKINAKVKAVNNARRINPQQRLSKRIVPLANNQVESLNSSHYIGKCKNNYFNRESENNIWKGQNIKNRTDVRAKDRYSSGGKQYDHPPSSVHLNEIIEAIKENRNNDKCDNTITTKAHERELETGNYKRNKCYKVYGGTTPPTNMRKTPLKNNAFIFSTNAEPIFGLVNTETLLGRGSISRNFSTSSKYKPFLENLENKNNKKVTPSNFLEKTLFSVDSFIPEELEKENPKKMSRQKFYLKYMENQAKQREDDRSLAEENKIPEVDTPENQTFSQAEYVEYRSSCKEELFKKSIDGFASNTAIVNNNKNEYSPVASIPGIVERYNIKHSKDKQIFSQIENNINKMSARKFWKVWDPKSWENEADMCRNELLSKGFSESKRNDRYDHKEKNYINFNEALRIRSKHDDNYTKPKVSMNNDMGKGFHKINPCSTIHSSVNYSNCFNVGDLGLNFTSFALNKPEGKKEGKENSKVGTKGRDDLRKSVNGSESRINNVGVENTSMSRQTGLHTTVRETRTVGLRPCNKNEGLRNSFRIRNSFLMDGNNTLRPVISTNALYRRQASSGISDNNDIKTYMSEKIKNIKRIDHVDYIREEKCVSDKEAIESIKVKESFVAQSSVNGNSFEEQASAENDIRLGICSKEIETRAKHKKVPDSSLTKQTTEEINVTGLFPEGKKSVYGKVVSVYGKPKNKFTTLQNRVKGLEAIHGSPFKEPVTVQMVYETTTDRSVGEHIDKAKNKINFGNVQNCALTENDSDRHKEKGEFNRNEDENDAEKTEQIENKSKVWKKYDPKMTPETKKYFVDTKKLNKAKRSRSVESIYKEHDDKQENNNLQWHAPRNRVIDKLVNRDGLINEWKRNSEIIPLQNDIHNNTDEVIQNNTFKKKKCDNHESVEVYYSDGAGEIKEKREDDVRLKTMKMLAVNNESLKSELETNDKTESSSWNNDKFPIEEEALKGNLRVSDEKMKTIEGKAEIPTIGESKYEIDSDSVDDRSNPPKEKEKEKLVITHFKQFRRSENPNLSNQDDKNNFILEASMLRVTLVEEKKTEKSNKNSLEVQSFESISNDAERELNDMISPYIKEFMLKHDQPHENKLAQIRENKIAQLKSKEYFLNLLYPKNIPTKEGELTKSKTELENIENIKDGDNDIGIKIGAKTLENDAAPDMAHILRASIEKVYMKHVNYIMPTEPSDLSHQLRASIENIYTKKYSSSRKDVTETENISTSEKTNISDEQESITISQSNKTTDSKDSLTSETTVSQADEPSKLTKTYDLIAKELNKMFVKDKKETDIVDKLNKESVEAKLNITNEKFKTDLEQQQQFDKHENNNKISLDKLQSKNAEPSFQESVGTIESSKEPSQPYESKPLENKVASEKMSSNEIIESAKEPSQPYESTLLERKVVSEEMSSNDTTAVSGKGEGDQMINNDEHKSKPAAKSYYSYDSTIKPKLSKLKRGIPSDNTSEVKEATEEGINDDQSSGKRNRAETKLRLPIFKPKLLRKRKTSPITINPRDSRLDKVKRFGVKDVTENKVHSTNKKNIKNKLSTPVEENNDLTQNESTSGAEQNDPKLASNKESKGEKKIVRKTPSSFYSYDSTIKPHFNKGDIQKSSRGNDNEPNLKNDISTTSEGSSRNMDEVEFSDDKETTQNNKTFPQDLINSEKLEEKEKDFTNTSVKQKQEPFLNVEGHDIKSTAKAESNGKSDVLKTYLESQFGLEHQKQLKTAADYIDKFEEAATGAGIKTKTDTNISSTKLEELPSQSFPHEIEDSTKLASSEIKDVATEAQDEVKSQIKEKSAFPKTFSKDMIIEDLEEKLESSDNKQSEETLKTAETEKSYDIERKVEEQKQSEFLSLDEYKKRSNLKQSSGPIASSDADEKTEEYKIDKEVYKERMRKEKKERESTKPLKQYVPYEGERKPNVTLEKWEQEPTYLKNLRPAYYKMVAEEKRMKNYDENEKKFKNLKTLNRISSANKYSDCECNRKEKWTADMCCSLEEEKEMKQAGHDVQNPENESDSRPESRNKLGRPSKARSSDWPDNLIRKKDAVIKQPMTPRPPWRN